MKKFAILVLAFALMILPMAAMAVEIDSLAELKQAISNGDTTVVVTGPITINESITWNPSQKVTVTTNFTGDAFTVTGGATLTLGKNVSISSDACCVIWADGGNVVLNGAQITTGAVSANSTVVIGGGTNGAGTLTMNSGSITANGSQTPLYVLGNGSNAAVKDGTITSEDGTAITAHDKAVVTISGGTVKTNDKDGYVAAFAKKSGQIIVTGGTITSATGAAVDADANGIATISGGTMSGKVAVKVHEDNGAKMTVSGGTFSDDSAYNYLEAGLTLKQKNGKFVVGKISTGSMPSTGDSSSLMLWSALMVLACTGFVASRKLRRE